MNKTVVFLHPHFLKLGGASKVVLEQKSRLDKKGIKCELIYSEVSTGSFRFWLTFPYFFFKLLIKLNTIPNKIIYCHSIAIYWGYLYKLLYPKTVMIIYFHDLGFPYFDSEQELNSLGLLPRTLIKLMKPLFFWINRNVITQADYLIANSNVSAKFILDKYNRREDLVCTPGVDLKVFKPLGKKQNYVVTVGRLEKIKNIDTTINGFIKYLNNSKSKFVLKIAGVGREKYPYHNQVEFLGNKSPAELAKLYSEARLGIFMSPFESFGLTAIECLACGTPIIGVNQNGIGEIVKNFNSKYLVDNSPIVLAQKIVQVINIDNSKQARQAARIYSWDNQVDKLALWFKSLP